MKIRGLSDRMDAAIGDADHGFNLSIGFQEVLKKMPEWKDKDIKVSLEVSAWHCLEK